MSSVNDLLRGRSRLVRRTEQTTCIKGDLIDLWYLSKAHHHAAPSRPYPAQMSWDLRRRTRLTHDLTARTHLGRALRRCEQANLPTLTYGGYQGAGLGSPLIGY